MGIRALGNLISPAQSPLSNLRTAPNSTQAQQYQGMYTLQGQGQAAPNQQWVQDPYGSDTVLAIQPNNVPVSTSNNLITDSATNCTLTRVGNVTQGTFTPYSSQDGAWGSYFDGAGDYLTLPNNAAFSFGTGDFTIEAWVYVNALNGTAANMIIDARNADGFTPYAFLINNSSKIDIVYGTVAGQRLTSATSIQLKAWQHVAVTRASGTIRLFVNGVRDANTVVYASVMNIADFPSIGAGRSTAGSAVNGYYLNGYISNLRILKGTALYTTDFSPSGAPLTAIANTQLLTCQSNRFVDNSANGFTVTNFGNASVSSFSPFPTQNSYTPRTYGGSMFFDGSNDYLTFPDSAAVELGTSDFCFECFFYTTTITGTGVILVKRATSAGVPPILIWRSNANIQVYLSATTTGSILNGGTSGSMVVAANKWNYFALCRNGTSFYAWLNGTYVALTTSALGLLNNGDPYLMGIDGGLTTNPFSGYISNARLTVGSSVYGAIAAQPKTILAPFAGGLTQVLTAQGTAENTSGSGITVTASGAIPSAVSPFYVPVSNDGYYEPTSGSLYFDGTATGDYLTVASSTTNAFVMGTSDFTIEARVYLSGTLSVDQYIYDARPSGTTTGLYPTLYIGATTVYYYVNGAGQIASNTLLTAGQWYWIVVSRASGVTRMFINGVQQTATYTDTNTYLNGASRPIIGASGATVTAGLFTGYMNNYRVVIGTGFTSATINNLNLLSGTMFTNTRLLLNANSGGMVDSTSTANLETSGPVIVSTNAVKYGAESMYFDGTGDWLTTPVTTSIANPNNLQLGVGDFTIETWVNIQSYATVRSIASKGAATTGWTVDVSTTGLLQFSQTAVAAVAGKTPIPLGTWTHIAVVRSGMGADNIKMYVNGLLDYVSAAAVTTNFNQTETFYIGASRTGTTPMLGYMSDFRITKRAKYLSNFIPPRATLPRH